MISLQTPVPVRHFVPPAAAAPATAAPFAFLPPAARAILALDDRGCRWPRGALDDAAFGFCGAPRRLGSAYCVSHHRASRAGGAL